MFDVDVIYIGLLNYLYCEVFEVVLVVGKVVLCEKFLIIINKDVEVLVDVVKFLG